MRFREVFTVAMVVVFLSACGGAASPTSIAAPTTAVQHDIATVPSTGVPSVPVTVQSTGTQTPAASAVAKSGTPTVLGTTRTTEKPVTAPIPSPAVSTRAASTAPPPAATPQPQVTKVTELPSSAPQQSIGAASDGLVLLNVRSGKNEGYTRVVFDIAKQDGSAAPLPRTRLWTQDGTVVVVLSGVRDDLFAQSLGAAEQPINLGAVQSVYRVPVRDDSATAYGIVIKPGAKVTLSSVSLPTRVVIDVADK
jgi:hypothetical protein